MEEEEEQPLSKYINHLYVFFIIKKMIFRKASSASTIANLSRNRILLKMVLFFFSQNAYFNQNKQKNMFNPICRHFQVLVHSSIILTFVVMKFQIQTKLAGL